MGSGGTTRAATRAAHVRVDAPFERVPLRNVVLVVRELDHRRCADVQLEPCNVLDQLSIPLTFIVPAKTSTSIFT
jgi:hypothetical protein